MAINFQSGKNPGTVSILDTAAFSVTDTARPAEHRLILAHPRENAVLRPFEANRDWECFDSYTGKDSARGIREYDVPDFRRWKEHDLYREQFDRLLKNLQDLLKRSQRRSDFSCFRTLNAWNHLRIRHNAFGGCRTKGLLFLRNTVLKFHPNRGEFPDRTCSTFAAPASDCSGPYSGSST